METETKKESEKIRKLLNDWQSGEDLEVNTSNNTQITPHNEGQNSLRMRYQAEAKVIEQKLGDIEAIRRELGLTKRKMGQLLLVDPSSLTRWTQKGDVPPYIYRALQWYMALVEKKPEWHPMNSWLGNGSVQQEIKSLKEKLDDRLEQKSHEYAARVDRLERERHRQLEEIKRLRETTERQRSATTIWKVLLLVNLGLSITFYIFLVG